MSTAKCLLSGLTYFILISCVGVSVFTEKTMFDRYFLCFSIVGQVMFLLALATRSRRLTDLCHVLMVLSLFVSVFLDNACLVGLALVCLIIIQVLWIVFGHCIVNDNADPGLFPTQHAYGKHVTAVALLQTVILATRFGWLFHTWCTVFDCPTGYYPCCTS
jgi:hypothetical protein